MPLKWTISHPLRLVHGVVEGELAPSDFDGFLRAIDAEGTRTYPKIVDVSEMTTEFDIDRIRAFAQSIREREMSSDVGAVAIVAKAKPLHQAMHFVQAAQTSRLIKVFRELDEARRWIEDLPSAQ